MTLYCTYHIDGNESLYLTLLYFIYHINCNKYLCLILLYSIYHIKETHNQCHPHITSRIFKLKWTQEDIHKGSCQSVLNHKP